ncbi:MAG: GNAT family protein [Capsulimonadales bacterium]|nr:GNAT family protein [Capsulimonadales bacterium]
MLGPTLIGERVRLIAPNEEMLPMFIRWLADPEVVRFLGIRFPPSIGQERDWFDRVSKSADDIVWVIAVGDRPIGTSGIHRIDWRNRRGLTGSLIGEKDEWRKGYATEAHRLRTRYAFEELNLEKLESAAIAGNAGSIRALEKAGYRQCGLARRHEFRQGQWHDEWRGEVLRDEWRSLSNTAETPEAAEVMVER